MLLPARYLFDRESNKSCIYRKNVTNESTSEIFTRVNNIIFEMLISNVDNCLLLSLVDR